jgi:hypothetical protein
MPLRERPADLERLAFTFLFYLPFAFGSPTGNDVSKVLSGLCLLPRRHQRACNNDISTLRQKNSTIATLLPYQIRETEARQTPKPPAHQNPRVLCLPTPIPNAIIERLSNTTPPWHLVAIRLPARGSCHFAYLSFKVA